MSPKLTEVPQKRVPSKQSPPALGVFQALSVGVGVRTRGGWRYGERQDGGICARSCSGQNTNLKDVHTLFLRICVTWQIGLN